MSGNASAVICDPTSETADAVQYLRNSRSRQRPVKRTLTIGGLRAPPKPPSERATGEAVVARECPV
jgi:hypothetical protein